MLDINLKKNPELGSDNSKANTPDIADSIAKEISGNLEAEAEIQSPESIIPIDEKVETIKEEPNTPELSSPEAILEAKTSEELEISEEDKDEIEEGLINENDFDNIAAASAALDQLEKLS